MERGYREIFTSGCKTEMIPSPNLLPASLFVPGEVLALLSPLQELEPGLYLLRSVTNDWATICWLIDDEASERILITDRQAMLPAALLEFFTSVGLHLSSPA